MENKKIINDAFNQLKQALIESQNYDIASSIRELEKKIKKEEIMEKQEYVIGEEYEFSDDKEIDNDCVRGILIYIDNDSDIPYWCKMGGEDASAFAFIRPIHKDKVKEEPRFIETDIYCSDKLVTEDMLMTNPPEFAEGLIVGTLLSTCINSKYLVGFKFEGYDDILSSPVVYEHKHDDVDCITFLSTIVSETKEFKILRANKVVWSNPNYKK